jgi:membrane fusion protein YbhG
MSSQAEVPKPAPKNDRQPAQSGSSRTAKDSRLRRYLPGIIFLVVIAGILILIWRLFLSGSGAPQNMVTLSGRIEGDESAVASKTSGRILEIRFREGDSVNSGDTIAILDDEQIRAREDQAHAAVSDAEARARAARQQILVLREQLRQSQLQVEQARIDAAGRVRQAEAELTVAQSELAKQEAAYRLAAFDKEAYGKLAETGAVSERRGREAVSNADQQAAAVAAAKRRVESARGAVTVAKANLENPGIRAAGAGAIQKQINQQEEEVSSAMAKTEQARAQLEEAQASRKDLTITAPFSGTVTTRSAEPGEVVTAGTAIVTLLDLNNVYLRGYVPEGQIGNVKIGQAGRVYLDSNPNQPLEATVSRIDPEATFTPENTYFRDERVKQVVGIKLQLKAADGRAKPGMPADGEILIKGDTWPQGQRSK